MGRVREMFSCMAIGVAVTTADMTAVRQRRDAPGHPIFSILHILECERNGLKTRHVWTGITHSLSEEQPHQSWDTDTQLLLT